MVADTSSFGGIRGIVKIDSKRFTEEILDKTASNASNIIQKVQKNNFTFRT